MKVNMKVLVVGVVASSLSSCTWVASTPSGIREFYRGNNGLVTTGKSKPNVADEYHITQRATDRTSLELLQTKLQEMNNE